MIFRPISFCSLPRNRARLVTALSFHYRSQVSNRMASTLPNTRIFQAIASHDSNRKAIVHSLSARGFTYGSLLHDVAAAKEHVAHAAKSTPLRGQRIAFLAENGYDFVVTLLSIWANDAVAVPLAPSFPIAELQYVIEHSQAALVLSTRKFEQKASDVVRSETLSTLQLEILDKIETGATSAENVHLESGSSDSSGLMLYTSGTTSRPKGVILSQSVIAAQARSLIEAWNYTPSDYLLHVLPLHHIHGIINALVTPLVAGCTIEFAYPFNADVVWKRFAAPFMPDGPDEREHPITFFTVVPTIYSRLLSTHPALDERVGQATREAISPGNLRLNISGSAALPTPIKSAWTELSHGNVLLERYGMTEVGMALSCGLSFDDRVDGSVGWPLPSVEVRLVETDTGKVIQLGEECDQHGRQREGEIQLRGPTIFSEYWRNPSATSQEFVDDMDGYGQWFKTGDVASRQPIDGAGRSSQPWAKGPLYFIKGRSSVDIIKTGGEKVSALEIERELLSLPQIAEAAVIGLKSEQWGQKVAAVVVLKSGTEGTGKSGKPWGIMDMRRALRDRLVNYKVPQELKIVQSIPRNAMGKINKKTLSKDMFGI